MELNRETIDGLTTTTILDDDVFYSLLEVADPIDRERALQDLQRRAKEVGRKTEFERLRKVFEREQRQMEASNAAANAQLNSPILLKYTEKGVPAATIDNFAAILNNDPELKDKFWLNELSMTPERSINGKMQRWTDADDSWLRGYIERKYRMYSPPKLLDALETVWQAHRYHPIRDKIKSLAWDGRPRLKRMLIKWLRADDCQYSEEVSRLIFAGGIHRVFEPGCKFEDMAVLIGQKQGEGKSTFVRMLAMDDKFFREVNEIDGQRGSEAVEGAWICEVSELLALKRSKEVETAKSYFSRQVDAYRRPFDRRVTELPRQCIFVGTTNNAQFLTDKTGNRRYYPVICQSDGRELFNRADELKSDIAQCWAEAYTLYQRGEMPPFLDKTLIDDARWRQEDALEDDYRVGMIAKYLNDKQPGDTVCIIELWSRALREDFKPTRKDSNEISAILQNMPGWVRCGCVWTQYWGNQKGWRRISAAQPLQDNLPF